MQTFEELIFQSDKTGEVRDGERELFVRGLDIRETLPFARFGPWTRYRLRTNEYAPLETTLLFRDPTDLTEFRLRIAAEVRLGDDIEGLKLLTGWKHSGGGIREQVQRRLAGAIENWHRDLRGGSSLLGAVLASGALNGAGMSEIERAVLSAVRACGFQSEFVRVVPLAWIERPSIELDEKNAGVRLSDHPSPVKVHISGELVPVLTSEALYKRSSRTGATLDVTTIHRSVIEAMRAALGGTRLQTWVEQDGAADLREAARAAGNREAARFGWKLSQGLLLRSDVETVIGIENFEVEGDYKLPGAGRKLTIVHTGSYELQDAALYEHMKQMDPACRQFKELVATRAREVTTRKLQRSTYAEAIQLLSNSESLERAIQDELSVIIARYGHKCSSCHVVVKNLPEMPLLEKSGFNTRILDEQDQQNAFRLAVHNRTAKLGLQARLNLEQPDRLERHLNLDDTVVDIVEKVAERARLTIAGFLNGIQPDQFRRSDLSFGPRLEEAGSVEHEDPVTNEVSRIVIHPFQKELAGRIAHEIRDVFGIALTDWQFFRGDEPVSRREQDLRGHDGTLTVSVEVPSEREFDNKTVTVTCHYKIVGTSPVHALHFEAAAIYYGDIASHREAVEKDLRTNMTAIIKQLVYEALRGSYKPVFSRILATALKGVAERRHGLVINIDPGGILADVPPIDGTGVISDLQGKIEEKTKERTALFARLGGRDAEDDEELLEQIARAGRAIEAMKKEVQNLRREQKDVHPDHYVTEALQLIGERLTNEFKAMYLPNTIRHELTSTVQPWVTYRPDGDSDQDDQPQSDDPVFD